MYLTRIEEKMLNGEMGEAKRIAMKLIVRVGEALGAERLIEVSHAHASGISYSNIGDPGLELIESLARDGRVETYSTFNPVGTPLEETPPYPVPEDYYSKQKRIIEALLRMGFKPSATCIPYKLRSPRQGEHLAWGESSAVAVANSLYAARTNREGGPLALAAALAGRTYYWGLHREENRRPTLQVVIQGRQGNRRLSETEAGITGYLIGKHAADTVPYIKARLGEREAIALCAAAAASGNIAHCLIEGLSPEAHNTSPPGEKIILDDKEFRRAREELETASLDEAEVFFTGCPHHEPKKLTELVALLENKRPRIPVWVAMPGQLDTETKKLAAYLKKKGVHVLPGTCLVVSTLKNAGVRAIATDSAKTAFYMPKRHGVRVALAELRQILV